MIAQGFLAEIECQKSDLPEGGGKGKQESGHTELFAADGNQIAAQKNQQHKQQGKQCHAEQVDFGFVHNGGR